MSKVTRFIAAKWASGPPWFHWATNATEVIHDTEIELEYAGSADEVKAFAPSSNKQLIFDRTSGTAWDIANVAGEGNGLESYRQIKHRYEPRTAGTKRALLKQLICIRSANRVDEVEQKVRHMEELIKRYETMSGSKLPEDLKVTGLIDLCCKEIR